MTTPEECIEKHHSACKIQGSPCNSDRDMIPHHCGEPMKMKDPNEPEGIGIGWCHAFAVFICRVCDEEILSDIEI